ncbi:hypothetical protein H6P81_014829 [Aristolochia fimbriata]|uniref:DUF4408 domain-containing protein n=1 Tax=Aristolochia fimbriata TaxID=158543 RepID=A0AAV7E4N3_ARIFI|nr:hypothetical protein H6P81_014829 [Aristolochia fimbriata]
METSKHRLQSLQSLVELKNLRRALEVLALVSLSVVSVLFSDLSWLPGSVTSIDIFPVSSFVSGFLQYYMNKTVVFLLCNGILVIVSGYPCFVASSYNNNPHEVPSETHFQEPKALTSQRETTEATAWAVVNFAAEKKGEELGAVEEECKELQVIVEQKREDEDEDDEEDEGVVYSGESDARFEDFIRRTKEGMRSEARRLLIVM